MKTYDDEAVEDARALLKQAGYVVLKEKSYRQAQERQRVAECYKESEIRAAESARAWAHDCLTEERRLRDRCTFLYGAARAAGCTVEELREGGSL
jgi:hypothetical protein